MLKRDNTILVFIDVQGHLARLVDGSDLLFQNLRRLLEGMKALEVPVLFTEQIPDKLGPTRDEFQEFIADEPIVKSSFGCCDEPTFFEALEKTGRRQIILCGIETHICVYQTALELLANADEVYVVTDAVSSRDPANKQLALQRMEAEGMKLTGTEMLLFELTGNASDPAFKTILKIVK